MLLLPRPQKWILQWLPQHTLVVLSHVRLFVRVCKGIKGRLTVPFWMNFRKTSKRPVTPSPAPPLFPKTVVRFFLDVLKSATKIFGSEMAPSPPFGTFPKSHPKWKREASLNELYVKIWSIDALPYAVKSCQKPPSVTKICHKLPWVVKSCQKLSKVVKSWQKLLSKVGKSCQKLAKTVPFLGYIVLWEDWTVFRGRG